MTITGVCLGCDKAESGSGLPSNCAHRTVKGGVNAKAGAADRCAFGGHWKKQLVGCGRDTIYRALNAGELHAKKLGRLTRIPADEAKRFIDSLPDAKLHKPGSG